MPTLDDLYDPDEEQARLAAILDDRYLRVLSAVHELVAAAFPDLPIEQFRLDDAATRTMLDHAAEQVVRIDETTRGALRNALQEGQRLGLSNWEIANGAPAKGFAGIDHLFRETWASRAQTVARNELAEAQHVASLNRYAATGKVDRVKLVENSDTDEPCARRNGQVVPLSSQPARLHVNCRLGLIPVVNGEE